MKAMYYSSESRGGADHGWLKAKHSFSFASYYDPERMGFGALRVLNDDEIAPNRGFGTHPHDNMEIITIPFEGSLEHKDSMGNSGVIDSNTIQVMSAGKGIQHSEVNPNSDVTTKLFQIWVTPDKKDVEPRYDQLSLENLKHSNKFNQILSPNPDDDGVWIHQQSWFYMGEFSKEVKEVIKVKGENGGVYVIVIEGEVNIGGKTLKRRDALGLWDMKEFSMDIKTNSKILVMEVPLS